MKFLIVLTSIILTLGCGGSYDPSSCETMIIDHELRNFFHEIVDSTNGCETLRLTLDFQVCDANLEKICGYYYPNYWYGNDDVLELYCFDLFPSSAGISLEWDMLYPEKCQDPNFEFTDDWDLWVEVWLVYGNGQTTPIYTIYIPITENI